MALRFRKSFKLAPGMRMHFSGSGASLSLGPRGTSVSIGRRGVYSNVGIPGTGLSSRTKLSGSRRDSEPRKARPKSPSVPTTSMPVSIGVRDDGELYFQDTLGNPIPEALATLAKAQHADAIRTLIQQKCDEINQQIEDVARLHEGTPDPRSRPSYVPAPFEAAAPPEPQFKTIGLLAKLFPVFRRRVEQHNESVRASHDLAVRDWRAQESAHADEEARRRSLIEDGIYRDVAAMETFLEEALGRVHWPRETTASAEVLDSGRIVHIDVDLPEIEDMPRSTAAVPARGMRLAVKEMSAAQVQRLYMRHVHAVAFRILGEVFAALPLCDEVLLSGYSQRRDKGTGQIADEYLYSARVVRAQWMKIDFSQSSLVAIDVVEALARFDLRRSLSKTGVFKAIDPFAVTP